MKTQTGSTVQQPTQEASISIGNLSIFLSGFIVGGLLVYIITQRTIINIKLFTLNH